MAKTKNPLLSADAKGRVGHLLVFYGKGYVREWETQTDPQTEAQLQFRAVVAGLMGMIKIADALDRKWLRTNYAKSWHTKLVGWLTMDQLAKANELHDAWESLSQAERDTWENAAP